MGAVGERGGNCPLSWGRDGGLGDAGVDFPLFVRTFVQQNVSA